MFRMEFVRLGYYVLFLFEFVGDGIGILYLIIFRLFLVDFDGFLCVLILIRWDCGEEGFLMFLIIEFLLFDISEFFCDGVFI